MPRPSLKKYVLAIVLAAPAFSADPISAQPPVIVHEWGTFTSVAGANGVSLSWAPLAATSDLPCFVHRLGKGVVKFSPGLIRMETPVVYFYSKSATRLSVHVDFPEGWITEWYPKATHAFPNNPEPYGTNAKGGAMYNPENGAIDWTDLAILPGVDLALPTTTGASRYFAARAADSAPLQAGGENEKLLFYRGIANFKVPVEPVLTTDGVKLHNNSSATIPLAILFENRNGAIGYRIARDLTTNTQLPMPDLTANIDTLRADLTRALEQSGLYPKEAAAMVETWRDSWFEEGMRVFYIMPRASVDKVLPLKVSPTPQDIQRAFVGRVEILSPSMEQTIRTALAAGDIATLRKFGRFLPAFVAEVRRRWAIDNPGALRIAPTVASFLETAERNLADLTNGSASCVQ